MREADRWRGIANVDEVFIDLCRQMLRKDDDYLSSASAEDGSLKLDTVRGTRKRRRRARFRHHGQPRCIIL